MALTDVSREITIFQRLCKFAEEFTEEHLDLMVEALSRLFQSDLAEEEEAPDVPGLVHGLIRRLRATLTNMVQAETELLASFKANIEFRILRDRLTAELRQAFDQARTECRNHFTRVKADAAGFPARIREDAGALLRQTRLVSWMLRRPDFTLGEPVIESSTSSAEFILGMFEPKVLELETALSDAVRRRARSRGKQVAKDNEVTVFRATYSLFVSLVKASFRLAGQPELAKRMTLAVARRSTADAEGSPSEETGSEETGSEETGSEETGSEETGSDDSGEPARTSP